MITVEDKKSDPDIKNNVGNTTTAMQNATIPDTTTVIQNASTAQNIRFQVIWYPFCNVRFASQRGQNSSPSSAAQIIRFSKQ